MLTKSRMSFACRVSLCFFLCFSGAVPCQAMGTGDVPQPADTGVGDEPPLLTELEVLAQLDPALLRRSVQVLVPSPEGGIGRNKRGYRHVRFQVGASELVAYGLTAHDRDAVERGLLALAYAFDRQRPDGGFELVLTDDLRRHLPADPERLAALEASGTAFFLSDAGRALLLLQASSRFSEASDTADLRARLDAWRPKLLAALQALAPLAPALQRADRDAPNRLLFDAGAFYLAGSWAHDPRAVALGRTFLSDALARQRDDGVFVEHGGHDSSYQLVSLELLLALYCHLRPEDEPLRARLWRALHAGAAWSAGRVRPDGEVSTAGNSRVRPGGERFLGKEKALDPRRAVLVFLRYGALSGDARYHELAERVIRRYWGR